MATCIFSYNKLHVRAGNKRVVIKTENKSLRSFVILDQIQSILGSKITAIVPRKFQTLRCYMVATDALNQQ
jgi:hypothetical protein